MTLHSILWASAGKLASSQTVRRIELYAEMARLRAYPITDEVAREIAAMEAEAENCGQALRRLGAFRPDKDPSCPHCWIMKGEHSPLMPVDRTRLLRCSNCGSETEAAEPI